MVYGNKELRKSNHRSLYVYHLQEKLIENGYDIIADGYFGDETEAAVIDYQKRHPILHDEKRGTVTNL